MGPLVHGRYVPGSLGFLLQLLRQRPRVHIMSRWRSICAAQSVSAVNGARGLDGVASTARCAGRARYRSVCRSYTGVTLTTLTGPQRTSSVAVSGERLVSFFTFRAAHRARARACLLLLGMLHHYPCKRFPIRPPDLSPAPMLNYESCNGRQPPVLRSATPPAVIGGASCCDLCDKLARH